MVHNNVHSNLQLQALPALSKEMLQRNTASSSVNAGHWDPHQGLSYVVHLFIKGPCNAHSKNNSITSQQKGGHNVHPTGLGFCSDCEEHKKNMRVISICIRLLLPMKTPLSKRGRGQASQREREKRDAWVASHLLLRIEKEIVRQKTFCCSMLLDQKLEHLQRCARPEWACKHQNKNGHLIPGIPDPEFHRLPQHACTRDQGGPDFHRCHQHAHNRPSWSRLSKVPPACMHNRPRWPRLSQMLSACMPTIDQADPDFHRCPNHACMHSETK